MIYAEKIPVWDALDRHERRLEGKEIMCVYRHNNTKGTSGPTQIVQAHFSTSVPSRSHIFQALLAELEAAEPSEKSLEATMLSYLNEAILIAEEQSVHLSV
jgi:hypothetical protein